MFVPLAHQGWHVKTSPFLSCCLKGGGAGRPIFAHPFAATYPSQMGEITTGAESRLLDCVGFQVALVLIESLTHLNWF